MDRHPLEALESALNTGENRSDPRLPIVGYKSLRLAYDGKQFMVTSPQQNTEWSKQGLTTATPTTKDEVGVHGGTSLEVAREYYQVPEFKFSGLRLDRLDVVECSVYVLVTGGTDKILMYPKGWRAHRGKVVAVAAAEYDIAEGGQGWGEVNEGIKNRTNPEDFGGHLSAGPMVQYMVEQFAAQWGIPLEREGRLEAIAPEFGHVTDYRKAQEKLVRNKFDRLPTNAVRSEFNKLRLLNAACTVAFFAAFGALCASIAGDALSACGLLQTLHVPVISSLPSLIAPKPWLEAMFIGSVAGFFGAVGVVPLSEELEFQAGVAAKVLEERGNAELQGVTA
jgi:hypothetical protein